MTKDAPWRRTLLLALLGLILLLNQAAATPSDAGAAGSPEDLQVSSDLLQQPFPPVVVDTSSSSLFSDPVPAIPNFPDCQVRPQTLVEAQRMRESATRIAELISQEVEILNRRKVYIEQMTVYLNDRIRELNKVKGELREELRWIEVSNHRIAELAEREKLIKLQDVLSCLNDHQSQVSGRASVGEAAISKLKQQQESVQTALDDLKQKIEQTTSGTPAASS